MPTESRGLRLSVIGIVVFSLFVALFGRLWYLQIAQSDEFAAVASANQVRTVPLTPMRGRILDRTGRILADNDSTLNVTIERSAIKDKTARNSLFQRLAGPLKTTPEELQKRFDSGKYSPYQALPLAENVDESTAIFLKERREDYPGVEVEEGFLRKYRFAPLASQIIGYMGAISMESKNQYLQKGYQLNDRVGVAGVEKSYEGELRGKPGYIKYAVDARNRVLGVVEEVDPVPGNDVQLTVDLKLQLYTEQILQAGIQSARTHQVTVTGKDLKPVSTGQTFSAPAGAAVIQDPNTGEVLAMASYPTFDNRWFVNTISDEKVQQLFPVERSPLVNRAISGQYSIGSTMKLFTSVAALQSGQLNAGNYVYDDKGTYEIPDCYDQRNGCVKKNSGGLKPGKIDLPNALAMSSDDYFYRLGVAMWQNTDEKNVFQNTLKQFGFGTGTGIDMPDEYPGRVPTDEVKKQLAEDGVIEPEDAEYFVGDNVNLAIGGGLFAASPMQLVNGYSTFANGGDHLEARVAAAVLAPGAPTLSPGVVDLSQAQPTKQFGPVVLNHVDIPQDWQANITRGLVGVLKKNTFPTGTAYKTFLDYGYDSFPIAGKTGTTQGGNNEPEKDSSLFVGFGPVGPGSKPNYTIGAVIERGGFGAEGAAPVVKCLFEAVSGQNPTPLAEPQQSDPLDPNSTQAGTIPPLADPSCVKITQSGSYDY